jgi:hypothetical protein
VRGALLMRCAAALARAGIVGRPALTFRADLRALRATRQSIEIATEHPVSRNKRVAARMRRPCRSRHCAPRLHPLA